MDGWKAGLSRRTTRIRRGFVQKTLTETMTGLIAQGVKEIDIVPTFMARGGHLKRDLPALVETASAALPAMRFIQRQALGEAPGVIAAMARHIAENRA